MLPYGHPIKNGVVSDHNEMSRGYGKYRRGGSASSHPSFQFDSLFKENSNRPSAARSAATVGKWGITSFTSIRANGTAPIAHCPSPKPVAFAGIARAENEAPAQPKPKKFFKSRNVETPEISTLYRSDDVAYAKKPKLDVDASPPKQRKFFAAKSPPEETKPPIVLRICRGKSQLLNDSDESESTPTPTPTPSTSASPRGQRSPNCRITRSARRSMQQEPNGSPPTADTACEYPVFTSPKAECERSPQYIPAEEYELERKAMYDNLLKPTEEDEEAESLPNPPDIDDKIEESSMDFAPIEPPTEKIPELLDEIVTKPIEEPAPAPISQPTIENDWDSESDSNDTEPKIEPSVEDPKTCENDIEDEKEEDNKTSEPVKLVISKKKGSIFKSRTMDVSTKRRVLYRHKWSDDKDATQRSNEENRGDGTKDGGSVYDDFGFSDGPLQRVTKNTDDQEVTSIQCSKSDKGYYTVVRNVKKAHQIQEIGEFQEFNDDVEYILDALQDNNPISTRCLSAITLASKCMVPAFRMHVRAHGTVAKFFKALHDATKDQSLGLCTATVMFVLSQDRLNMDLDRDCLELMLNLLESDVNYKQALDVCGLSSAQLEKNKQKVRELCEEIQSQGHAIHLNLDNITVGQLAMETLLSLTSKRAGEWFKEELRELGGLEHIMKTVCECCRQVSDYVVTWTERLLDKLRKVDRCLRVLENVTHNNEENQTYLLKYEGGMLLDTLINLYKLCDREIPLYPMTDIADKESTGTIIREALLVTLKVLINLTHHFNKQSMGSALIGAKNGIIETSLHLLLQVPNYIPDQKKFELGVLVLMLLINLIQDNDSNKKLLMEAKAPSKSESIYSREESAVEALIAQFYHWEGCAKIAEKRTNAILDGEKDTESTTVQHKSNEEFIEETVAKLLQKAGTHMEYTFLASYIVMVVGFLIMDNVDYQTAVRQFLKGNNFVDMVELLKKFFNFMNLTASTEASNVSAVKATEKVINFLEDCDKPPPVPATTTTTIHSDFMDLNYTMAH